MNVSFVLAGISAFSVAVALFYAPLAYGCTRPEMLPTLFYLLAASIITGVLSLLARGNWTSIPRMAIFCVAAILLQGWWMAFNPDLEPLIFANQGLGDTSLENIQHLSFDSMQATSFLLCTFLILQPVLAHPGLRRFLLLSATLSGGLICLIGIFLKTIGSPYMHYIWKPEDIYWNDFAFYRYHGNAGAFLNLAWPLILAFARRAYAPTEGVLKKIVWTLLVLACACALFLNASKSALIIGLLILPWPFSSWLMRQSPRTLILLGLGGIGVLTGGLLLSSYLGEEAAFQRLTNSKEVSESWGGRIGAYQQYLDYVPSAGLFGVGPGRFQIVFPYQISPLGNGSIGLREYAHEDFMQTVIEWGFVGTFAWTLLVAGGLNLALRTYARRELFSSKTDRHLLLAAILGVGGTLAESLIDFPLQIASIRLPFMLLLAFCWASPQLLMQPLKTSSR